MSPDSTLATRFAAALNSRPLLFVGRGERILDSERGCDLAAPLSHPTWKAQEPPAAVLRREPPIQATHERVHHGISEAAATILRIEPPRDVVRIRRTTVVDRADGH
jgi:hypothetical protein